MDNWFYQTKRTGENIMEITQRFMGRNYTFYNQKDVDRATEIFKEYSYRSTCEDVMEDEGIDFNYEIIHKKWQYHPCDQCSFTCSNCMHGHCR